MSGKTKIEWSEAVWNPATGCSKVSSGCANCYAETLTKRYAGANGWPATFLPWTPANAAENVVLHPDRLEAPFSWRKPRRVFVNSMSDLFHEQMPDDFIDQVFQVMALARQHTFQVLTKRPKRMRGWMTKPSETKAIWSPTSWPLPNVWLGVTVENQRWADERIPILLDTPAAVRFISCEPLLGPVDLKPGDWIPPLGGGPRVNIFRPWEEMPPPLDWVIVGGESGPKHRPFDPSWARSIVAQCREAGVAAFVKQLGGARPGNKLEDLPEDLRVREYPS